MPQLIPLAIGLGGSLLGAKSGSGNQGGTNTSGTLDSTDKSTQNPLEAAYFSSLRQSLTGPLQKLLLQSQQPVYGDAAKAGVLNDLNDLASDSVKKLRGTLGARGQWNSGFGDLGQGQIEAQRFGKISDFMTGLPAMEQNAQFDKLMKALGLGTQWTGAAPLGKETTSTTNQKTTGTAQIQGVPAMKSFLGDLAGMIGGAANGKNPFGLGDILSKIPGAGKVFGGGSGGND